MDRFYNAVNALEAARSMLFNYGEHEAAATLQGLEVYSAESAEVALDAIRRVNVHAFESKCALIDAAGALEVAAHGQPQTITVAPAA